MQKVYLLTEEDVDKLYDAILSACIFWRGCNCEEDGNGEERFSLSKKHMEKLEECRNMIKNCRGED